MHEFTEIADRFKQLLAFVGIGDIGTAIKAFYRSDSRGMLALACDKGLMLGKIKAVGVLDKSISGDTGSFLIRL